MENTPQKPLKEVMVNWLFPRFEAFEAVLALAALLLVVVDKISTADIGPILIVVLGTLAYMYFLMAFAAEAFGVQSAKELAFHKLSMWSCAIACLGVLFFLNSWENPNTMLTVSSITLAIVLGVVIHSKSNRQTFAFANNRYLLRMAILCLLGVGILVL